MQVVVLLTHHGTGKQMGQGSSNTDGYTNSTVSVNTTAGFSIVKYTGTGSQTTVGHGLGVVPDMMIIRNLSSTEDWSCIIKV